MSYTAPYIDSTGLHASSYSDILDDLIQSAKSIYGQDVYLEPDSLDYQFISDITLKIFDTLQAAQYAYDSRSVATAIGTALDALVRLSGITRIGETYSTCPVVLSGTAGTVITAGIVQDINNYKWNLPSSVTIGPGGTVTATATCQVSGPIVAAIGDISKIITPVYGWDSVTNAVIATPGTSVEVDSALRGRQASSKAISSKTMLDTLNGAIADTTGVTRWRIYENQTNSTDANGLPTHSITCVVEGGTDANVANTIYAKRGIGCLTNGTTTVNITDDYGQVIPIGFYRPSYVAVDVIINVHMLTGYVSGTTDAEIKAAVVNFLNSLGIGKSLSLSFIWAAAMGAMSDLTNPTFSVTSITMCAHGGTPGTSDINVAFNEAIEGVLNYITVNAS